MARRFAERQVRRLPYLFSVAPPGFSVGMRPALTPPSLSGFPETHGILSAAWEAYLAAVECIFTRRPYLLGERFTIADAAVYGQLGMNLADPTAADAMRRRAPTTFAWLCAIRDRRHVGSAGPIQLDDAMADLLGMIGDTFIALMQQNERAYVDAYERGERLFNEPAFDARCALYDGTLLGKPFRSVAKTFQVRVWRELRTAWQQLPARAQETVDPLVSGALLAGPTPTPYPTVMVCGPRDRPGFITLVVCVAASA
jgi:hypothetical protein